MLVAMAAFLGLACVSGLLPASQSPSDELEPPPPPKTTPQTPVGAADREPIAVGEGEAEAETAPAETLEAEGPTPEPTPVPTVVPPSYDAPAPEGAVARLGRGRAMKAAFSPDGQLLAVLSEVGVFVYRADTFELLWAQDTELKPTDVAFNSDGRTLTLMTSTRGDEEYEVDSLVQARDAQTGELVRSNAFPSISPGTLIGPDSSAFALDLYAEPLQIVDIATGEAHEIGDDPVAEFAFSPDGSLVASAYEEEEDVDLWDVASGERITTLDAGDTVVTDLAFSHDGSLLAAGTENGTISVWETATEEQVHLFAHPEEAEIEHLAFGAGDASLAAYLGSTDSLAAWDLATGERLVDAGVRLGYAKGAVFSPDGSMLVYPTQYGINILDPTTGETLHTLDSHLYGARRVSFSPDGSTLAVTISPLGGILLWDVDSGQSEVHSFEDDDGQEQDCATFSPNGEFLATGSWSGDVYLWDTRTWEIVSRLTAQNDVLPDQIAFSPDGSMVAAGGWLYPSVNVWHLDGDLDATIPEAFVLTPDSDNELLGVSDLAFSPDGSELAVASDHEQKAIIWDPFTGQRLRAAPWEGNSNLVESVAYSPDGSLLAAGFWAGTVIWDMDTNEPLQIYDQESIPFSVAFTPDGSLVAIGHGSRVSLWDVAADEIIASLEGHNGYLEDLTISPDGTLLASASSDGSVVVWDISAYQ